MIWYRHCSSNVKFEIIFNNAIDNCSLSVFSDKRIKSFTKGRKRILSIFFYFSLISAKESTLIF